MLWDQLIRGQPAGSIADFTSFSFHAVKNFTTAEGGSATWKANPAIDDEEMYKEFQILSLHGQTKDALAKMQLGSWEYDIVTPAYKCNMTDIMASLGLVQLTVTQVCLPVVRRSWTAMIVVLQVLASIHLAHKTDSVESSRHLYITHVEGASLRRTQPHHPRIGQSRNCK